MPASLVACRCASSKYAGTVTTASVTFSPRNASATSRIFDRMIALTSGGDISRSPTFSQASPLGAAKILNGAVCAWRATSAFANFCPMRRLTAYSVFVALVTACLFAAWPARRSPLAVNATTEGVVRAPSEFGMMLTSSFPPAVVSATATHEFVVPRSIPMIFPIRCLGRLAALGLARGAVGGVGSLGSRDDDHCCAEKALALHVARLHLRDDRPWCVLGGLHLLDCLVHARVEGTCRWSATRADPLRARGCRRTGAAPSPELLVIAFTSLERWALWRARSRLSNTGRRVRSRSSRLTLRRSFEARAAVRLRRKLSKSAAVRKSESFILASSALRSPPSLAGSRASPASGEAPTRPPRRRRCH